MAYLKQTKLFALFQVCLLLILANQDGAEGQSKINQEFVHLLNRASASNRLHIISELNRDNHRLYIEEYIDLTSLSQLIQFKWYEEEASSGMNGPFGKAEKVTVIVINDGSRKILVKYEPFECESTIYNSSSKITGIDWHLFSSETMKGDIYLRERHMQTIESIISTASNSPYLARLETGDSQPEAWLMGVAGLWAKAQFPGDENDPPAQLSHLENGIEVKDSDSWTLKLKELEIAVSYYFNKPLLTQRDLNQVEGLSNAEYEVVNMIELRDSKLGKAFDLINVVSVEFGFSDRLARDLFKIPIGFNCPQNPTIADRGLYFERHPLDAQSVLLDLEVISTKFEGLANNDLFSSTDIKSISIGRSPHPMNPLVFLGMFQIQEARRKIIRDFHYRLIYNINLNNSYGRKEDECEIQRLHCIDNGHHEAFDPVELKFNNGIVLSFSETLLNYIQDSESNLENEMRLLNVIRVSHYKLEYVYESQIPERFEYLFSIKDSFGRTMLRLSNIVRVYEQAAAASLALPAKTIDKKIIMRRRGPLKLARVILIAFDLGRRRKLAEIRLNFVRRIQPLSFRKRAQLFDTTRCHNLDEDSMQIVALYPANSDLISYAQNQGHELIESFYNSPLDWRFLEISNASEQVDGIDHISEKKRLGLSLNFLRVPKVELRNSLYGDDEFELHITVLDKASPLHLFDQLPSSDFKDEKVDHESLLVDSVAKCAKFCLQFNCKMFSYDSYSHECKLSPVKMTASGSIERPKDDGSEIHDPDFMMLIRKITSKIYFAPDRPNDQIESQALGDEASLAELHSFLEHSGLSSELDEMENDDGGEEDSGSDEIFRLKRDVVNWPLLAFQFTDRSDRKHEFAPPKLRLLVPSELRLARVPISLDFSEESRLVKVASAFKPHTVGKQYQLNELDDWTSVPKSVLMADERTFINNATQTYFTLKRFHTSDMEQCATICYNIMELDFETNSEQVCSSFSYCTFERHCIIVVKTDVNFTSSVLDLAKEGDLVLPLSSVDKLLTPSSGGCVVSVRNNLDNNYEGPLRLANNFFGYKSMPESSDYEWLIALRAESSRIEENLVDECAEKCRKRTKLGKPCLAFDTCISKISPNGIESSCHLFLFNGKYNVANGDTIRRLRGQLSRRLRPANETAQSIGEKQSHCNRYIGSHLIEFSHLRQRQLSDQSKNQLKPLTAPLNNVNLDNCALECSLRRGNCMVFEYCSRIEESSNTMLRNCSLFGYLEHLFGKQELASDGRTEPEQQLSIYSKDCHVYIRVDMKLLENLDKLNWESQWGTSPSDLRGLIVSFVIVYTLLIIFIVFYVKREFFPNFRLNRLSSVAPLVVGRTGTS